MGVWDSGGKTRTPFGERTESVREGGDNENRMVMCFRETVLYGSRLSDLRPNVVVVSGGIGIFVLENERNAAPDMHSQQPTTPHTPQPTANCR